MDNTRKYEVNLFDQQLMGKTFEFDEDDAFFGKIDGLIKRGNVHTKVRCLANGSLFRFTIESVGVVIVPCDRCLADLELRIETTDELTAKLGDEYDDDGDCVTVPEAEGILDLAQFIYEYIALSMPISCQHEPGKCDDSMMQELSKHQTARSGYEDDEEADSNTMDSDRPIDKRWEALLKLKQ